MGTFRKILAQVMKYNIIWQYLKKPFVSVIISNRQSFIGLCGITRYKLDAGEIKQEKEKSEQRKRK